MYPSLKSHLRAIDQPNGKKVHLRELQRRVPGGSCKDVLAKLEVLWIS